MRFPWQSPSPDERAVADEFVAYLYQEWPLLGIGAHDAESVALSMPDGSDGKLYLHKLHGAIAGLRRNNAKTRRRIYKSFAQQMLAPDKQIPDLENLDAAQMAGKVFPRVARPDMFAALGDDIHEAAPPLRPLPGTDFVVVYVLDFGDRVAYIMKVQAEALQMDEEQLWEHGLANARNLFPHATCRDYLQQFSPKKVAHFIECPDGHAGARLLLLPEYLENEEEVAAIVLENSAFLLAQVPPDNNWNPLRKVAHKGGSPHLLQPFLVTKNGIKAM